MCVYVYIHIYIYSAGGEDGQKEFHASGERRLRGKTSSGMGCGKPVVAVYGKKGFLGKRRRPSRLASRRQEKLSAVLVRLVRTIHGAAERPVGVVGIRRQQARTELEKF